MGNSHSTDTPRHSSLPNIPVIERASPPLKFPRSITSLNSSSRSLSGLSKLSSAGKLSLDSLPVSSIHPLQNGSSLLVPSIKSPGSSRRNSFSSFRLTASPEPEKYVWIAGKRFHNVEGSGYLFPCDDEEIDRMHLQHFMVRFAIQGNYLAPVSDSLRNGAAVLDVGCGPGSWTMEIAGEYPKSEVVGIDMTSMFPAEIKPVNCQFMRTNILEKLPFDDDSFDFIFMRFIQMGIEEDQWDTVLEELVRVAKPGAFIELVESDLERYRVGPCIANFDKRLTESLKARNMDPYVARKLDQLLIRHGLVNVKKRFISSPAGEWAGKLGQLTLQSWKAKAEALKPQLCMSWNTTQEQYESLMGACLSEADIHKSYENIHFAYGQKPILQRT